MLEAFAENELEAERRAASSAWLSAVLARQKRIPSWESFWRSAQGGDKARVLPPDEAAREVARHADLIAQLAPEGAIDRNTKVTHDGA